MSKSIALGFALIALLSTAILNHASYVSFELHERVITICPLANENQQTSSTCANGQTITFPSMYVNPTSVTVKILRRPKEKSEKLTGELTSITEIKLTQNGKEVKQLSTWGEKKKNYLQCGLNVGSVQCIYADDPERTYNDGLTNIVKVKLSRRRLI